jgi:hypothetical protein
MAEPQRREPPAIPDRRTWNRALRAAARIQQEDPVSPCPGGVIIRRTVGWRCLGRTWCLVEWNTWRCPNGKDMKRGRALLDTGTKC